jgi:hypothetical protein
MVFPVPRAYRLAGIICAAVTVYAGQAWAQGTLAPSHPGSVQPAPAAPSEPQVTYTPLRRPGFEAAPAPPPPPPVYPPMPPSAVPVYTPPPPVSVPATVPTYVPPLAPFAPSAAPAYPVYAPLAPVAAARPAAVAPVPSAALAAAKASAPRAARRAFGLGLDVGAPDGVYANLALVPADWLRLQAALGTNTASLAYRGGVSFIPVGWGPSFTAEVGHCNLAPTNSVIREIFAAPQWVGPYVQELGYTYGNAHLGFDWVAGRVTLFLHAGYSYILGTVHAPNAVVVDKTNNTTVTIAEDGKVTASTLSAKLGLVIMLGGS